MHFPYFSIISLAHSFTVNAKTFQSGLSSFIYTLMLEYLNQFDECIWHGRKVTTSQDWKYNIYGRIVDSIHGYEKRLHRNGLDSYRCRIQIYIKIRYWHFGFMQPCWTFKNLLINPPLDKSGKLLPGRLEDLLFLTVISSNSGIQKKNTNLFFIPSSIYFVNLRADSVKKR